MRISYAGRYFALAAVLVLVTYALLGFYAAPRLIRSALQDYANQTWHRPLSVGEISVNPFSLDATINNFNLYEADHSPLLAFQQFHVQLSLIDSLRRLEPVLQAVDLSGLNLQVIRHADQTINLIALIPPTSDPNAPLPRIFIHQAVLKDGLINLEDQARVKPLRKTLRPLNLRLADFYTSAQDNRLTLSGVSQQGEAFKLSAAFGLKPFKVGGDFEVHHLLATTIAEAAAESLPLLLTQGELDITGHFQGVLDKTANVSMELSRVDLKNFGLRAQGEQEDWVTLPSVSVLDTKVSLSKNQIRVGSVQISQPKITVWIEHSGALNLTKLMGTGNPPAAAEPHHGETDTTPWSVDVPVINITGLDAAFEDRTPAKPVLVHINPLDFSLHNFALPLQKPMKVEAHATINEHGELKVSGPIQLNPTVATLAIGLKDLDLPFLQPYLDEQSQIDLLKGGLSGELQLHYDGTKKKPADGATLTGDLSVSNFQTQDRTLHQDLVKWKLLLAKGVKVQSAPLAVQVNELIFDQPYARFTIEKNRTTNLSAALQPAPASTDDVAAAVSTDQPSESSPATSNATAEVTPTVAHQAQPLSIGVVKVENGSMNFSDLSVFPSFSTGIQTLNGTIQGLSPKAGSHAEVALNGKVDRYAPVSISGQMNLLAAETFTNLKLSFRNLELTTFSPYSGKFAGYHVDKGKMTVEFEYRVKNRQLDAQHHLILDQLELGDKVDSPDATRLPVKFALSLLKDSNGVIDLELPVRGSLDDPRFRIGPIIWKVFVNLLEKAVTAPFRLLGSLFGDKKSPEVIVFVPGSAELDETALDQTQTLRKGLSARPSLKLDIPMSTCQSSDKAAFIEARWSEQIHTQARRWIGQKKSTQKVSDDAIELLLTDPKSYRALLESLWSQAHGAQKIPAVAEANTDPDEAAVSWLESNLKSDIVVPTTELTALGRRRAEAIERGILDGSDIDPARIFLVTDKPANCEDSAFVGLTLGLK